jgi:DNA-directed RNA polymerase specialized sigma subunit
MTVSPRDKDIQLWEAWRRSRSETDLQALTTQMMPILRKEIGRWSSSAPAFLLENEAKKLAKQAFETYDTTKGVLLSTHLTNQLLKLSRTAYARQSTISVPEHQRITFNRYNKAKAQLEDQLGRVPTHHELSDHLAIAPAKLQAIVGNVAHREYMESGEGPTFQTHDDTDYLIHLAYRDLTPRQQQIFEMRTGYNGALAPDEAKIRSGAQIQKQLGITQGVLSYELQKIKERMEAMQKLR